MSVFTAGDDVWVEFDGVSHRGEVLSVERWGVVCRIVVDPLADYGSVSARLAPVSVVCVRSRWVRRADDVG